VEKLLYIVRTLKGFNNRLGAALNGHLECVQLLVQNGSNINLKASSNGFTPLHSKMIFYQINMKDATINGHKSCVAYLIKQGSDLTLRDKSGFDMSNFLTEGRKKSRRYCKNERRSHFIFR
jgi:ankyrin repeat protein